VPSFSIVPKFAGGFSMRRVIGISLLLAGSAIAMAAVQQIILTPEIDPTSAVSALMLVAGGLVVIRGRRKT
jgi:hypothetical protein